MRPPLVVLIPPALDQHLGFLQRVEDLPIQELIPQLAARALDVPLLPWAPWLDEQCQGPQLSQLASDPVGRELRCHWSRPGFVDS